MKEGKVRWSVRIIAFFLAIICLGVGGLSIYEVGLKEAVLEWAGVFLLGSISAVAAIRGEVPRWLYTLWPFAKAWDSDENEK